MKYVIFKQRGAFIPVIVPDHAVHSMVNIGQEAEAISAGFFKVTSNGQVETFGVAESIMLAPHRRDAGLIEAVIRNDGIYSFLITNI